MNAEYIMLLKAYTRVTEELATYPLASARWQECYVRRASIQELLLKALLKRVQSEGKAA